MSVETIFDMGEMPTCPVCGKPVSEVCRRTGAAGRKGEYREWHLECGDRKRKAEGRVKESEERLRIEKERDDRLLQAWLDRRDALESLGREIADYNGFAPGHDRAVVEMVYQITRQAILMFQIRPMIPIDYGDDFRWLSAEIGSDGMDLDRRQRPLEWRATVERRSGRESGRQGAPHVHGTYQRARGRARGRIHGRPGPQGDDGHL